MNPISLLQKIKTDFPLHQLPELELESVCEKDSPDIDIYGAILTLIKRSDEVLTDPIIFSNVCLGLAGISPDFQEFDFPSSEHIYLFFSFLEKAKKYFPFKAEGASEELKYFISVILGEEGIYFLTGELEPIQEELLSVYEEVFGNPISKNNLETCKARWIKYEKTNLEEIPEIDEYDIQVKQNIFMRDYSNGILNS